MSRSTQYIGLNQFALNFVEKAIRAETFDLAEDPFGGHPIQGTRYFMEPPEGPNREFYFEEVVQDTPWSSGPMFFTCLKQVIVKDDGHVDGDAKGHECFRWMLDPSVRDKGFERETGRYWA